MGVWVTASIFLHLIFTTVESYRIIDAPTANTREKTVTAKPLRFESFYQTTDPIGTTPQAYIAPIEFKPYNNVLIVPTGPHNPISHDTKPSAVSDQISKSYEESPTPAASNEAQGFSETISYIKPTDYANDTLHSDLEEQKRKEIHYHQHKQKHLHNHNQEHRHRGSHDHQHRSEHSHSHQSEHLDEHQSRHQHEHRHEHIHQQKHEHKHKSEHDHSHTHQHGHEGKRNHSHSSDDKHLDLHKREEHHRHDHQSKHDHKRSYRGLYQRISIQKYHH